MFKTEFRPTFLILYLVVFGLLAVTGLILFRINRSPEFRIRWQARIVLISSLIIMFFMMLAVRGWLALAAIIVFGGLIMHLNITKTTICRKCGKRVQGVNLIHRAKFCPECGGETVRSKIFTA